MPGKLDKTLDDDVREAQRQELTDSWRKRLTGISDSNNGVKTLMTIRLFPILDRTVSAGAPLASSSTPIPH